LTVLALPMALAAAPDLTLTESTYAACLSAATNQAAQITVEQNQATLHGPTSDLSAVYAVLAGVSTSQGLTVASNQAGTESLQAAQACLAKVVPTVGAGRLHQVRSDIRCATELFVDGQTVFSNFDVVNDEWITLYPDGVQDPTCDEKRHVLAYELSNGDMAAVWVDEAFGKKRKNKYTMSCENADCMYPEGNNCLPGRLNGPMGKQPGCLCTGTGDGMGCLGSSSSTTEDEDTTCPAQSMF
jgi:hypothetical protein